MHEAGKPAILITKASGEQEPFRIEKLKESLRRSGAGRDIIEQVAGDIEAWLVEGVSTRKIYARAFSLLRKKKKQVASRYKLKQAIMEMGPTGYPFERLVGKVIERQGYAVEVGQIVQGRCVSHEVDVVAVRDHHRLFVECKYGLSAEKTVNVQVPLYVRSRVNDIIDRLKESGEHSGTTFGGGVATNTRFTSDAIDYGTCSGLFMLSWDYPAGDGLKDIIDRERLYPITVLHSLTKQQKQDLLGRGIVVCRQILEDRGVLSPFRLAKNRYQALMRELDDILN
ncbi:MAG: ATP-binding protein [Acidobacteria bacterium]|nr:ATP-binding protein [Acidobacteriota bacterium]